MSSYEQKCSSIEEAKKVHSILLERLHESIGFPNPRIRQSGTDYCIDIPAKGDTLKNCLRQKECKNIFKEVIQEGSVVFGTRVSAAYKKIIRELIGVNVALENTGLICSYKLTDITLLYERNNNATAHVTVCAFRLRQSDKDSEGTSKQIGGDGWTGLNTFIDNMNASIGVQTWDKAKNEMIELKKYIANGQTNGIFDIPFFWSRNDSIHFIHSLCSYLKVEGLRAKMWVQETGEVFNNWVQKGEQNEIVKKLMEQDEEDRSKLTPAFRDCTFGEDKIRGCVELMRDCYVHLKRMSSTPKLKEYNIQTQEQLLMVFEEVFPNHIEVLAHRAKQLNILGRLIMRE